VTVTQDERDRRRSVGIDVLLHQAIDAGETAGRETIGRLLQLQVRD
jgi:hypothetical protein